jgi:O-antigen ligase
MSVGFATGNNIPASPPLRAGANAVYDTKFALWALFFFATSMASWQYLSDQPERYAWLLADFVVACLFLRYQSQFINLSLTNIVFMSWPVLACVSALWSLAPGTSLYHGLQFLMTTLVAFLLCVQFRLQQLVEVIFWGMLLAAFVTLAAAILPPNTGIDWMGNWRGAFPTKNVMGDAMVLLVVCGVCLFLQGRLRLVTSVGILIGFFLIVMTRSATPLLSILLTLAPLPFAYAYVRGRSVFMTVFGLTCVVTAVAAIIAYVAIVYYEIDPVALVLGAVGKERTLTGRTWLWDLAREAIDNGPFLGLGFKGYWDSPPAGMLQVRATFHQTIFFFHNNFLEVQVAYGIIGPILLSLGIVVAVVRVLRRLFYAVDPIEIWPLLIIVQVIIQSPVQYPLMVNHSLWHVAFIVAAVIRK